MKLPPSKLAVNTRAQAGATPSLTAQFSGAVCYGNSIVPNCSDQHQLVAMNTNYSIASYR